MDSAKLIQIAKDGDNEALRDCLKSMDGKSTDEDKGNNMSKALSKAAENEKWECVKMLVEAGADVNGGGSWKALNYASFYNNVECVELLIKAGANVNHFNNTSCLNLTRDVKVAELLIKAGADVNCPTYDDCFTPIANATESGKADLVKLLIESGAEVNNTGTYMSVVEIAVYRKHSDCVRILAPLSTEHYQKNAFLLAAEKGEIECLKVFIEFSQDLDEKISVTEQRKENSVTALMRAADGNEVECMKYLIQQGVKKDTLDVYGNNALMRAAINCKVETMTYCIQELGMDVNGSNNEDETALMKVIDQDYVYYGLMGSSARDQNESLPECVKLLVKSGADVNKLNKDGDTALNLAAKQNQLEYVKIILSAGSKINIFNKAGHNAYISHAEESKIKSEDLKLMLFAAGESKKNFLIKISASDENEEKKSSSEKEGTKDIDWSCWSNAEESSEKVKSLKEICREGLRKQLSTLDPFQNLFKRIPLLGLPSSLKQYILFNLTFDLQ